MNAKRRVSIEKIISELTSVVDRLSVLEDEEQECVDNTPENLWETERYAHAEECVDILSGAQSDIDSVIESLKEV